MCVDLIHCSCPFRVRPTSSRHASIPTKCTLRVLWTSCSLVYCFVPSLAAYCPRCHACLLLMLLPPLDPPGLCFLRVQAGKVSVKVEVGIRQIKSWIQRLFSRVQHTHTYTGFKRAPEIPPTLWTRRVLEPGVLGLGLVDQLDLVLVVVPGSLSLLFLSYFLLVEEAVEDAQAECCVPDDLGRLASREAKRVSSPMTPTYRQWKCISCGRTMARCCKLRTLTPLEAMVADKRRQILSGVEGVRERRSVA